MQTLSAVLGDETNSGPARLEKNSRTIDKRDSLFIVKYVSLSWSHWPMIKVIKNLQNSYKLKWLRPPIIFSRHANLHQKLLRDLQRKVLWGVVDADFGPRPCNYPRKYEVNGECAYGDEHFSCCTAGSAYKISCNANNCNCFYIGKSQQYIKTSIQEHIGEVRKLYNKHILLPNQTTTTPPPTQLQGSTNCSSTISITTQSRTSYQELPQTNPMCVVIKDVPPLPPIELTLCTQMPSDVSNIDPITVAPQPPIVHFENLPPTPETPFYARATTTNQLDAQQENCSAFARHLFVHVKRIWFKTKAEVAEWCCTHIKVGILWRSNTISLIKTAGTKVCKLFAVERMIIGHNFTNVHRQRKILNIKSEQRGVCSCKTRFLWFARSE